MHFLMSGQFVHIILGQSVPLLFGIVACCVSFAVSAYQVSRGESRDGRFGEI